MPNRRDFIKSTSLAAGATALTAGNASGAQPAVNAKQKLFHDQLTYHHEGRHHRLTGPQGGKVATGLIA